MLYKDTTGKMDIADPSAVVANANLGLKERYVFSRESGILEITGQLFCDVFRSERLLLSFVDLKVIKVKVSPSISIAHELSMKKGPAIYPVRRVECKTFVIAAGNQSLRKDNLYNGLVPKTFAFGMVDSAAFNGEYK